MAWYAFRQNNSGGSHSYDDNSGISVNVYIEAADSSDANDRAERIGIYFDGVESGIDCNCCGDRWYTANESDVIESVPEKDAILIKDDNDKSTQWISKNCPEGEYDTYVHPLEGEFYGAHAEMNHILRHTTGYGLGFSAHSVGDIIEVGDDGWDKTGNMQFPAPAATSYRFGTDDDVKAIAGLRIETSRGVFADTKNYSVWSKEREPLEKIQQRVLDYLASVPEMNPNQMLFGMKTMRMSI